MSGRWKLIISLGLLVSLITVQFIISRGVLDSDEPTTTVKPSNPEDKIQQSLSGVHIVENNGAKQVWELWASKGALNTQNTWSVQDIKVDFFADTGIIYDVTAPEGVVNSDKTNDVLKLKLFTDVVTHSSSGYTFYSKEAEYIKANHELFFPGYIKMTGPVKNSNAILLTGTDMNIYLTTNEIKIHKNIFARHKGLETITLNSQSALLNGQTKTAKFIGNVQVKMSEYNVNSNQAVFNFNKTTLTTAEFTGNLKVWAEDKRITANKLLIDFAAQTLTFQGNGLLESGTDILSGDEIVVSNQGRKIQISNAKATINPNNPPPKPFRRPKID
jgi:lipopolysaccharide export system protein LptA